MKSKTFHLVILIPILSWYMIFMFWPIANAIRTSFFEWNTLQVSESIFIGLRNYTELFGDRVFQTSFINTLLYVVFKTGISIPLAIMIALLLIKVEYGRKAFIFLIFLPNICAIAAISILFRWLYQPTFGLFNNIIKAVGLPPMGFLNDPNQALFSVIATDIWQGLGYQVIILLAGLLEIPDTFTEAATIDGARSDQTFFRIKLPLLGNVLLFVVVTTLITAFQVFDRIAVMTEGEPGKSTYVMAYFIYRQGLYHYRAGYATAAALILFFMVMVVTIIQFKLLKPKWEY